MKHDAEQIAKDPRYIDIGNLPSNFYPYGFTKLHIRPFTVAELKLVSKSAILDDYSYMLKAVDMVITEELATITIGDFYYILMWLLIHSTPKTPHTIDWHCPSKVVQLKAGFDGLEFNTRLMNDGSAVVPQDASKYDIIPCGTHNTEIIHMTTVDILCLDETNFAGLPPAMNGVTFDFPRVGIMMELKEALKEPGMELIVNAAQWIKGGSLADKLKVLENQPDLDVFDMASVLDQSVVHGISEKCTLTCRGCLQQFPYTLKLDPLTFFR